ncbi:unnamed protein product [Phytophthora lilii]|uniref:Unnamed protein product n=1 Tax=Phytophthora lilii TaxID=2077276 RepID=A0A9W6X479_9STRA|nr:unnamed protein product [Phytophthora lilii]
MPRASIPLLLAVATYVVGLTSALSAVSPANAISTNPVSVGRYPLKLLRATARAGNDEKGSQNDEEEEEEEKSNILSALEKYIPGVARANNALTAAKKAEITAKKLTANSFYKLKGDEPSQRVLTYDRWAEAKQSEIDVNRGMIAFGYPEEYASQISTEYGSVMAQIKMELVRLSS